MSPASRRCGSSDSGFTLIEVLVIVVIVGIISAVVLLSFSVVGDDRSLQQQARRLTSLIDLAGDEATLQGRDFGLEFTRGGYRFLEFDHLSDEWHEVVGDELLHPRTIGENLELQLVLEDRDVDLAEQFAVSASKDEDERNERLADNYIPHVLIMSSGDTTPFELHILRPDDRGEITVKLSPAGAFDIRSAADAAR